MKFVILIYLIIHFLGINAQPCPTQTNWTWAFPQLIYNQELILFNHNLTCNLIGLPIKFTHIQWFVECPSLHFTCEYYEKTHFDTSNLNIFFYILGGFMAIIYLLYCFLICGVGCINWIKHAQEKRKVRQQYVQVRPYPHYFRYARLV